MSEARASAAAQRSVRACPCCGLAQVVPVVPQGMRACCARCNTRLHKRGTTARSNEWAAAIALAALVLYPLAVTLPMIRVEQFGYHTDTSIIDGTTSLLASGQILAGVIVLLCSIIFPLGKLIALLVLSAGPLLLRREHRAWTYRVVEWTGRWGMMDVLLVALLVAVLKLGDMMEVSAGPAAFAFTSCVVLSLIATALFDPHGLWPTATSADLSDSAAIAPPASSSTETG